MIRNVKVSLLLAQFVQEAQGLVNMIGGGITVMGPDPSPVAIAGAIELPWDAAGVQHQIRFELIDSEGQPVLGPSAEGGEVPIVVEGHFDVAPAPGTKRGTPLTFPIALNLPPQPIPPDGRYEWRLYVDGETHEDWRLGFTTRPAVQSNVA
ncbi:MAG TPA: hypothetical protein VK506_09980 [Conexibacter sp.]|nr:hypothetical protein [Conexibacter sp.]